MTDNDVKHDSRPLRRRGSQFQPNIQDAERKQLQQDLDLRADKLDSYLKSHSSVQQPTQPWQRGAGERVKQRVQEETEPSHKSRGTFSNEMESPHSPGHPGLVLTQVDASPLSFGHCTHSSLLWFQFPIPLFSGSLAQTDKLFFPRDYLLYLRARVPCV